MRNNLIHIIKILITLWWISPLGFPVLIVHLLRLKKWINWWKIFLSNVVSIQILFKGKQYIGNYSSLFQFCQEYNWSFFLINYNIFLIVFHIIVTFLMTGRFMPILPLFWWEKCMICFLVIMFNPSWFKEYSFLYKLQPQKHKANYQLRQQMHAYLNLFMGMGVLILWSKSFKI